MSEPVYAYGAPPVEPPDTVGALKPCPLCGGEAHEHTKPGPPECGVVKCQRCGFWTWPGWWVDLPRPSEAVREVAAEMGDTVVDLGSPYPPDVDEQIDLLKRWAARLESIGEGPPPQRGDQLCDGCSACTKCGRSSNALTCPDCADSRPDAPAEMCIHGRRRGQICPHCMTRGAEGPTPPPSDVITSMHCEACHGAPAEVWVQAKTHDSLLVLATEPATIQWQAAAERHMKWEKYSVPPQKGDCCAGSETGGEACGACGHTPYDFCGCDCHAGPMKSMHGDKVCFRCRGTGLLHIDPADADPDCGECEKRETDPGAPAIPEHCTECNETGRASVCHDCYKRAMLDLGEAHKRLSEAACDECEKRIEYEALHEQIASAARIRDHLIRTNTKNFKKAARYLRACKRIHREWKGGSQVLRVCQWYLSAAEAERDAARADYAVTKGELDRMTGRLETAREAIATMEGELDRMTGG